MFRALLILILFSGCDYYVVNPHRHSVSHISPKNALGPKSFKPCFEERILPNYRGRDRAQFTYGKDSLKTYFISRYDHKGYVNESGYITLRFIVNCEGEIGRFDIRGIGMDYKEKKFNPALTRQLMELMLSLKDWETLTNWDNTFDASVFYTFKIENGELVEILP